VYNGADGDGSGAVGEERGLLGAWACTEDPIVPLDRIVGVLDMDMIGRNGEVPAGGGNRSRGRCLQRRHREIPV
jgi:hypothetical protein